MMTSEISLPSTPVKQKYYNENIPSTTIQFKNHISINQRINYKNKTFELMNQIMLFKIRQKEYESQIEMLKDKVKKVEDQIKGFLKIIECRSFRDVLEMIRMLEKKSLMHQEQHTYNNKINQLLCPAKIRSKIQQQMKQQYTKNLLKKLQDYSLQHESNSSSIEVENIKLKNQLKQIKYQYQVLICQNTELRENGEQVRRDLKRSIDNYENIEIEVEEKMKEYLDKIKQYQGIIEKNKYLIAQPTTNIITQKIRQQQETEWPLNKSDFSFGKSSESDHHILHEQHSNKEQINTTQINNTQINNAQIQNLKLNIQCYRASIDGLLDENKRLKRSFEMLYQLKQGQQLPDDLVKQIDIMKSIMELSQNFQNN